MLFSGDAPTSFSNNLLWIHRFAVFDSEKTRDALPNRDCFVNQFLTSSAEKGESRIINRFVSVFSRQLRSFFLTLLSQFFDASLTKEFVLFFFGKIVRGEIAL